MYITVLLILTVAYFLTCEKRPKQQCPLSPHARCSSSHRPLLACSRHSHKFLSSRHLLYLVQRRTRQVASSDFSSGPNNLFRIPDNQKPRRIFSQILRGLFISICALPRAAKSQFFSHFSGQKKGQTSFLPGCPMFAENHAKMSEKPCGQLTAQPSWSTAIICRLSMNHHSGLQCEQPFGIKWALAKVVSRQNGQPSLSNGEGIHADYWFLTTRKTARFCNWLRIPPVRNQPAGLVQANGRRQMIAVLQDGCAVMRRAIQDGGGVGVFTCYRNRPAVLVLS